MGIDPMEVDRNWDTGTFIIKDGQLQESMLTNPPIAHPLWPYMTYYDQQKAFSVIVKTDGSFAALIKSELGSRILWISFRRRRRAGNCSGLLRCIDIDKKPFWLLGLTTLASTVATVFELEFLNFFLAAEANTFGKPLLQLFYTPMINRCCWRFIA